MDTRTLVERLITEGETTLDARTLALCEVADGLRAIAKAIRESDGNGPSEADETLD